jgi:hypothetical protein
LGNIGAKVHHPHEQSTDGLFMANTGAASSSGVLAGKTNGRVAGSEDIRQAIADGAARIRTG